MYEILILTFDDICAWISYMHLAVSIGETHLSRHWQAMSSLIPSSRSWAKFLSVVNACPPKGYA